MIDPIISAICHTENLSAESIQPLDGGQINLIYRINDSCILRVARTPADSLRLRQEAALLQHIRERTGGSIPVPEILAVGEQEGRAYQIQRRIPGQKLHRLWLQLSPAQKERVMAQLGAALETLHSLPFEDFGWFREPEQTYPTWTAYIEPSFRSALADLAQYSTGVSAPILDAAARFLEERLPLLEDSRPVLVHADLWPGNLLVEGDTLTGMLDFEFAFRAPRDYELVLIEDFCLYPNDFVEQDFETRSAADYADFFRLLARHTPDLFAIPNLRQRLDLYHVLFNLQLYAGWRKHNPQAEETPYLLAKLARITNMLFGHGVRMFSE